MKNEITEEQKKKVYEAVKKREYGIDDINDLGCIIHETGVENAQDILDKLVQEGKLVQTRGGCSEVTYYRTSDSSFKFPSEIS